VSVPVQRMLAATEDEIRARAETVAAGIARLDGWRAEPRSGASAVGGGSAPGVALPTCLIAIEKRGLTADALEARLRDLTPPVIARIEDDCVMLDLRTVLPGEEALIAAALATI
jgi:L-seryl-tRNA(Ser) seleniumtransferase